MSKTPSRFELVYAAAMCVFGAVYRAEQIPGYSGFWWLVLAFAMIVVPLLVAGRLLYIVFYSALDRLDKEGKR